MQVRMKRRFEFVDEQTGRTNRVPAGWAGDLPDDVVKLARKAGALEGAAVEEVDLDGMTKAELEEEAERRGVDLIGAGTKAEILARLKA
ncbi:hypothetical protein FHS85_001754 [Rhodoligotrophos appendicifer]|uniref:hypothetical protein n=1 Tax=Rhodoligotrophos appendicifer TaxID=987056 RepID=UPI001184B181|nr:hypothetical protein [Rhodoligotrophos appendicifer]